MMMQRYIVGMVMAACMCMPMTAWSDADCGTLQSSQSTDPNNQNKMKPDDVAMVAKQGNCDPPAALVPDPGGMQKGANASGSGGFSVGTVQAPQLPPQAAGAPSSASSSAINFNLSFTAVLTTLTNALTGATPSAPAAGAATPGGIAGAPSSCPVRDDTTGAYGALNVFPQSPTGGPSSTALSCGGAVSLTNYRITLVPNTKGLVVTEYNTPYVWNYRAGTNNYTLPNGNAVTFPKFLCEQYTHHFTTHRRRVAWPANIPTTGLEPQAQMITYNNTTQSIALRVVHTSPDDNSSPFDPTNQNEYFLVLPIRDGVPYVPVGVNDNNAHDDNDQSCGLLTDYYKPYSQMRNSSLSGDMVIESSLVPGCEETPTICTSSGQSTTPTTADSCQISTIYPSGASCSSSLQYMVLDHPNLLFPPGTTVNAVPVAQRTSSMVSSTSGSATDHARLIGPSDMVIHLNESAQSYELSDGGILGLANGNRLHMQGPATVDMSRLVITLPNGGEIDDAGGSPVNTYPANSTVPIAATSLPITLQVGGQIVMPDGYSILTAPSASVRQPLPTPK